MALTRIRFVRAAALALVICAALGGCGRKDAPAPAARVSVDGAPWDGRPIGSNADGAPRVVVTLDGEQLIELPFSEAHTVEIAQADGAVNVVELTGVAVFMREADCDNQDCVRMGEVTMGNLETRVMGGFIICLPHRLSVEVRGG